MLELSLQEGETVIGKEVRSKVGYLIQEYIIKITKINKDRSK